MSGGLWTGLDVEKKNTHQCVCNYGDAGASVQHFE